MHLGMSGRFRIAGVPAGIAPGSEAANGHLIGTFEHDTGDLPAHDHVVFEMSSGARIVYNDPRRFGFMDLVPEGRLAEHRLFAGLGVEPLGHELNADYLAARAAGRTADLKSFLLDQRIIAGLGNIYVSEALFRAGLSPNRRAGCLALRSGRPSERAERLVPVIRGVLEAAITAGGSTLRDHRLTDGSLGYFQHAFQVYGRGGAACLRAGCAGTVRRIVQAGRSTFYCGACQR
jgi:formamidopyrimidine-DNA glycosylase